MDDIDILLDSVGIQGSALAAEVRAAVDNPRLACRPDVRRIAEHLGRARRVFELSRAVVAAEEGPDRDAATSELMALVGELRAER